MKGLFLLIIVLLSILSEAAGQTAAPALNDLVVMAKVVGYGHDSIWGEKSPGPVTLYAEMKVCNNTDHARDISIMSCSWWESWIASGTQGLFRPTFQPRCYKNSRTRITIPVGEAVVFNCPLYLCSKLTTKPSMAGESLLIKIGFVDLKPADFWDFYDPARATKASGKRKKSEKLENEKPAPVVYWGNFITNEINFDTAKEITGNGRYFSYYLTRNRK